MLKIKKKKVIIIIEKSIGRRTHIDELKRRIDRRLLLVLACHSTNG